MFKIVKQGAQERWFTDSTKPWYSDTQEINEDWVPVNYGQLKRTACQSPIKNSMYCKDCLNCSTNFNAGWQACLKALEGVK
jgi:hypothetical protein